MTAQHLQNLCPSDKEDIGEIQVSHLSKRSQIHPLKNPLLLSIIANELSDNIADLKNFRMVCTSWRNFLPCPWKYRFQIWTIHQTKTSLKTTIPGADRCHWTLNQFNERIRQHNITSISEDTFQKFEFHSWNMEIAYLSLSTKTGPEFSLYSTFKLNMTVIILTNCRFPGRTTVFSEAFLRALPNLKTLVVTKPELSQLAWNELHYIYHNRNNFYEHAKLGKLFLEMNFTDLQFQELWATFLRSLPELKELSVKRLVKSHLNYKWIGSLLRTCNGEQNIRLQEEVEARPGVVGNQQLLCIETAPIEAFNEIFQRANSFDYTFVKLDWTIFQISGHDGRYFKVQRWFPLRRSYATIVELNLVGQIFESLCFLSDLSNLRKFVWKLNKENTDAKKRKVGFPVCPRVGSYTLDTMDIFVDPRIEIKQCNCNLGCFNDSD